MSSTFWLKAIIKSIEYGFQPIRGIVSISPGALPQAMVKEAFGQIKLVESGSNCLTDAKHIKFRKISLKSQLSNPLQADQIMLVKQEIKNHYPARHKQSSLLRFWGTEDF